MKQTPIGQVLRSSRNLDASNFLYGGIMNSEKVLKAAIIVLTGSFYAVSMIHNFRYYFPFSQTPDLWGMFLSILWIAFYILFLLVLKENKFVKSSAPVFSFLSFVSILGILITELFFSHANMPWFIPIAIFAVTPFYGISFLFGTAGNPINYTPFLICLTIIIGIITVLKISLFKKRA